MVETSSATVSGANSKKIMCINTSPDVAALLDHVFHDSPLVRKLGGKCGYTNISTWLKIAVVYLVQSNPSAEKLAQLHSYCKSDADLLSFLTGDGKFGN